jgi:hypothetical protein
MKTVQFSTDIKAPAETVWNALWQDDNYRQWTSVFSPGSYAQSDWKEGSSVRFLAPDGDGIYSIIAKMEQYAYMGIMHIGEVKQFKDQPVDESAEWSGAIEVYRLEKTKDGTRLVVDIDISPNEEEHFQKVFPQALAEVKRIAEAWPDKSGAFPDIASTTT